MSWPVYSYRLASVLSLGSTPISLGGPAPGTTWIIRWGSITWGNQILFNPSAAVSIGPGGPWSFIWSAAQQQIPIYSGGSAPAFCHYVVQAGQELWAKAGTATTVDMDLYGYILTNSGN